MDDGTDRKRKRTKISSLIKVLFQGKFPKHMQFIIFLFQLHYLLPVLGFMGIQI